MQSADSDRLHSKLSETFYIEYTRMAPPIY